VDAELRHVAAGRSLLAFYLLPDGTAICGFLRGGHVDPSGLCASSGCEFHQADLAAMCHRCTAENPDSWQEVETLARAFGIGRGHVSLTTKSAQEPGKSARDSIQHGQTACPRGRENDHSSFAPLKRIMSPANWFKRRADVEF